MKIIDLQLNIDGLILKDNETVDDLINKLETITDTSYDINYTILHEEEYG